MAKTQIIQALVLAKPLRYQGISEQNMVYHNRLLPLVLPVIGVITSNTRVMNSLTTGFTSEACVSCHDGAPLLPSYLHWSGSLLQFTLQSPQTGLQGASFHNLS